MAEIAGLENPHAIAIEDIYARTGSDPDKGISRELAIDRVKLGKNKIITPPPSVWALYLAPLFDVLIVVYLIMTFIMFVLAIFVPDVASQATFWLVFISANMALAIFQQFRAQKKMNALQDLSPPMATVIRENVPLEIKAEDLVVGDIIIMRLGDKVPADARVISSSAMRVNEASLTGESDPTSKLADGSKGINLETPLSRRKNMVYLGTFIQEGEGKAVVVQTGNHTEIGKIATTMTEMSTSEMPLRNKINFLGKGLSVLMVSFLVVILTFTGIKRAQAGVIFNFKDFAFDITQAIINAMAVMPINIPLLTTVVLITGVLNMSTKKVVIKDLTAVETLGRVSVLCSDKTGTMTSSVMTAKLVYDTERYYALSAKDDMHHVISEIESEHIDDFMSSNKLDHGAMEEIYYGSSLGLLLTSSVLNNKATIKPKIELDGQRQIGWEVGGNPTDAALLILAKTQGFPDSYVHYRYKPIKSYPFNSTVKRMSGVFFDEEEQDYMVFVKGATDVLLPLCNDFGDEKIPRDFTDEMKNDILERVNCFADQGYRVISVAYRSVKDIKNITHDDIDKERALAEQNLSYVGFVVIFDPPRPGVSNAVNDLDDAGIFPIMITGDSPNTAATIARQVGVLDPDELVASGSEIPHLDDEKFFRTSVFARVSPSDKEVIVSRYQARGDVIAMAGDGVNDALAITRADAGVAMGKTGTEITKDAADIIITDDSYVSMVRGVEEGRNLYEKIRMMVFFYIAVNLAEAIMYFTASFQLDFQILNNWQRVYIFGIIHALPVFAIIFGPSDKDIMKLKPRASSDILSKPLLVALALYAITLAGAILGSYFLYYNGTLEVNSFNEGGIFSDIVLRPMGSTGVETLLPESYAQAKARTMLLTIIYIAEAILVLSIRRINTDFIRGQKDSNKLVLAASLTGLLIHFSLMYITPLQKGLALLGVNLELIRLGFLDLLIAVFLGLLPIMMIELVKLVYRRQNKQF